MVKHSITFVVFVIVALSCTAAGEATVDSILQDTRYELVAQGVGSVVKGIQEIINTFVLDPTFRDHIIVIQQDLCQALADSLICYRKATIDLKLRTQTVQLVRNVAEALVDVIDHPPAGEIEEAKAGGPILDFANQLVHVFAKRPDLGKEAEATFVTFYRAINVGFDCFVSKVAAKRGDFFFVFRPFIESIRAFMAFPYVMFTGYLA